jgi:hypothetical protein
MNTGPLTFAGIFPRSKKKGFTFSFSSSRGQTSAPVKEGLDILKDSPLVPLGG